MFGQFAACLIRKSTEVELELQSDTSFIARPNLRSLESSDWDERVADLQYRDAFEFAVGHSVSTEAVVENGECRTMVNLRLLRIRKNYKAVASSR